MTDALTRRLVEALDNPSNLPVVFETRDGERFTLDDEHGPYEYEGRLVVPIVES